jgi:hypothetical protein
VTRKQNSKRNLSGFLPNSPAVLIDAGQRNAQSIVVVKIAAANDCNVFWDAYSLIQCVIDCAHRQWVIEAEN